MNAEPLSTRAEPVFRCDQARRRDGGIRGFLFCAALVPGLAPSAPGQESSPLDLLTRDVRSIAAPGVPSALCVWGPNAWPVVLGPTHDELVAPVVAAGRMGSGRFVLFGHDGYFGRGALETDDTARFMGHAVRFVAGARPRPRVGVRGAELGMALAGVGIDVLPLAPGPLADPQTLAQVDVLAGLLPDVTDADVAALRAFLDGGGGVIAAQCAWGWQQIHRQESLDANPLNRLFVPAGAAWTEGTLEPTRPGRFDVTKSVPDVVHAGRALDLLLTQKGPAAARDRKKLRQAEASAQALLDLLPAEDPLYRPRLAALARDFGPELAPTPERPIRRDDVLKRLLLHFLWEEAARAGTAGAAAPMAPFPGIDRFPGLPAAAAPRVTHVVAIDTRIPRWHSTGLYAAPGEPITVTLPPEGDAAAPALAGLQRAGLILQIGAHTDRLWELDEWRRPPELTRRTALKEPRTTLVSAAGGLVYIDVPERCGAGIVPITFERVIEAPRFVLGETSPAEWRSRVRARPGPWAELATRKIIVTVPSAAVRRLDDPTPLLELWDRVADAAAELVGIPKERPSAERYLADEQISAGYMHSGYPIMTHLDAVAPLIEVERLRKGDWGLFHELGHNHQEGVWTFDGTGEVTCNVVCLYILETACGLSPTSGHDGLAEARAKIPAYVKRGAPFEEWKADPFLALQMYVELRQAFGWVPYQKAFASYRELPGGALPQEDDGRRDLWLVTMSRACGKDLGRFFDAWGVPVSAAAKQQVKGLPDWMPKGWPKPQ